MYKEILSLNYDNARERFPEFESLSNEKRIIAMKNCDELDSFSNESDILAYYDILDGQSLLLLVERVAYESKNKIKQFFQLVKAEIKIKKETHGIKDFAINVVPANDKRGFDIIIVKSNIYDRALREM